MRKPTAHSVPPGENEQSDPRRDPRAFAADSVTVERSASEPWLEPAPVGPAAFAPTRKPNWWLRITLWAGGLLVSLGLGLMAERLIRDLFARFEWLGWAGTGLLVIFVLALVGLGMREILALRRLEKLDDMRELGAAVHAGNKRDDAKHLIDRLQALYAQRPDLAQARLGLDRELADRFDGTEMVASAERHLMTPLDERARALITAASRRVALVTAVSPRALVDLLFVAYESVKLARAIAHIYGGRPGLLSAWRLTGAVMSHLAVTGGIALGDSVIQQLLGHGLAARLSARLGEGLVNGLMTARVGIAAMRVTRPLPYQAVRQPQVMDFALDLGRVVNEKNSSSAG